MDPFYRPEVWKAAVDVYLTGKPASTPSPAPRQTHGLPFPVRLEKVRLPRIQIHELTLPQAVAALRDAARAEDPKNGEFTFVFSLEAAAAATRMSLSLDNIPFAEALRQIASAGGHSYTFSGEKIMIGKHGPDAKETDMLLGPGMATLVLSEPLARQWFPKAVGAHRGDNDPLWPAEDEVAKLGIALRPDTQVDFVPWMNCLAIRDSQMAIQTLKLVIEEAEARILVTSAGKQAPGGLVCTVLEVPDPALKIFKHPSAHNGLVHPETGTTVDALKYHGVMFPAGTTAWFDGIKQQLHLIQTEQNIQVIRKVLASEASE